MRILWHSNAPWANSGYGTQTRVNTRLLQDAGHEVAVSAFFGLNGAQITTRDGMKIYPGGRDGYGNDVILGHAHDHFGGRLEDGLIITLIDVWVMQAANLKAPARVASWVPVDHDPAPDIVHNFFRESDSIPIAMSRFGEEMLSEHRPLYVPHGIDTEMFKPKDRSECRKAVGMPEEAFVVGMVAANNGNPSRKSFCEAFQAFAAFREKNDDALLYVHSAADVGNQGINLVKLAALCGLGPDVVKIAKPYDLQCLGFPDSHMANLYNSMDVLLNPAMGEGFGIPVVEAQACGTPVIVSDFSAMRELCGAGWAVGGQKFFTYQESWQVIPSVDEIVHCLDSAYTNAGRMRGDAREFALQYDQHTVFDEFWVPAIEQVKERLGERNPITVPA